LSLTRCRDGEVAAAGGDRYTLQSAAGDRLEPDGHKDRLAGQEPYYSAGEDFVNFTSCL